MYRYLGLASGQLIQQETRTQLAILAHASNLLVLRRATAGIQMTPNVLM